MQVSYRLNANELDNSFLESLKAAFQNKEIEIVVYESDETAFLLQNPANRKDYNEWAKMDRKIYNKIVELIKDIERTPFSGIGKPEPLKYGLSGFWSRRISDEHRLVYQVTDTEILIAGCKSHYE
jgi:toxin YoeB